uniref:RNA-directed DNA polymerase n=2 Tax=Caenorhabditis tropicalis TaxID=1561998 RepID=A0A1I7SYF0_9PELO
MHEAHKERTAFCCHMGVFQYRYMPMGLKGAPDTFQRAMAEVEKQFTGTMILYVDDLIVVSKDEDQHVKDLEEFFSLIIKMGLKLKAEKSQIGRTRINFLGFIIENNTIQPNGEKTAAIRKIETPKTTGEVKSFLGMAGYFRRFIKDYAIIVKPLNTLLQKEVEFKWGEEEEKAFVEVKNRLISPPILTTPRMNGNFEMHTDASKIGIAAVLFQNQEEEMKVVAYASRATTPVEQRYAPIELEALAITWGLTHYRPYIFGKKVKVVTDHQPLKSLLHRKEKEMSGRLLRHQAIVQMYDVEIVYRPGKENPVADALSRQKAENEQVLSIERIEELTIDLKELQKSSKAIQKIKARLVDESKETNNTLHSKYMLIGDTIYLVPRKDGQIPPILLEEGRQETKDLIKQIHKANSHIGILKMINKLENIAVWNHMKRDIQDVVSSCECQRRKNPPAYTHVTPLGKWDLPTRPIQRIHVDTLGPLQETVEGNKLILVATDAFSKFAIAKAVPNQKTETVIKFLIENIVAIHGIPEEIVTDKGRNYISEMFKEVLKRLEITHSVSTAYHHETNGAVERFNRTLEEMLTLSTSNPENFSNWDEKLLLVIQTYNASQHSTTKYPPEYVVFGRLTVSPADIIVKSVRPVYQDEEDLVESVTDSIRQCHKTVYRSLKNAQNMTKQAYDGRWKVKEPIFEIGDKVVIRDHTVGKLMYQFSRPVTIKSMTDTTVTIITDRGKYDTVHKNRVKKFVSPNEENNNKELDKCAAMARDMEKQQMDGMQNGMDEEGNDQKEEQDAQTRSHRQRSCTMPQGKDGISEEVPLRRSRRLQNLPAAEIGMEYQ